MLKIFIGWDKNESVAWHVLAHSIMRRASKPVLISPVMLSQIRDEFTRKRDPGQSTDFSHARFMTPHLAAGGISVFMDCDMLCLTDITELEDIARANNDLDVLVVKHDYTPKTQSKFLGQKQEAYPKKNWSSLMVFNGHRQAVRNLTPEYINKASPMELHQFQWAKSVGGLGKEWNHLIGEYPDREDAKIVHYTIGGPWFPEYKNCDYSEEWFDEYEHMTATNR